MCPYINIFGKNLPSYSIMALAGGIAAMIYAAVISVRKNTDFYRMVYFMLFGIPFMLAGGMLLYYVTRISDIARVLPYIFSDFRYFLTSCSPGLVFYGGLYGFFTGLMVYHVKYSEDVRELLRYTVPAIPLFHAFGRVGCYLAGCCYGINGFPIQLAESGSNAVIFIILCFISEKCRRNYTPAGVYFVMYGTVRFVLEFFRGDEIRGFFLHLSTSQWISLITVPLGIYILLTPEEKNFLNKWYK